MEKIEGDSAEDEEHNPKMPSTNASKKVGVTILDKLNMVLECDRCKLAWFAPLEKGEKLSQRYWECPNGCNKSG